MSNDDVSLTSIIVESIIEVEILRLSLKPFINCSCVPNCSTLVTKRASLFERRNCTYEKRIVFHF